MADSLSRHIAVLCSFALVLGLTAVVLAAPPVAEGAASVKGFPPSPRGDVATSSQVSADGYRYSWAAGHQRFASRGRGGGGPVTGLWMLQQNAQPYVEDADGESLAHSIGQLWAIDRRGSCMSDVEMGWMVSPGQYGDLEPHLFIYAWDCGVGMGYVGQSAIPWVQHSRTIAPNSALGAGWGLHMYGVERRGRDWWFYYDGQWLGYIPGYAWSRFFPSAIEEGEAGGEVATMEYGSCAAMGNEGRYGSDRRAALVGNVWYEQRGVQSMAKLSGIRSDPQYTTGNWHRSQSGSSFRYGGPGWCMS